MGSNSLPLVPDLDPFPRPVRALALALLVLAPLCLGGAILVGTISTPGAVVEAAVVESPPTGAEVSDSVTFSDDGPVRTAVDRALQDGSASVETTVDRVREDDAPLGTFYVEADGRIVRVTVGS